MIKLNDLSLDFAGNIIFKNISLHIKKTDRIGLIGNNGSGKTTLLNLLSKKINPTAGSISQNKDINIAYLPQELYFNSDFSLKEFVVGNNSELIFSHGISDSDKTQIIQGSLMDYLYF